MVLQNYQNFTEMTSNMIYIVAFGVGLKCSCKIHLNTVSTSLPKNAYVIYEWSPSIYLRILPLMHAIPLIDAKDYVLEVLEAIRAGKATFITIPICGSFLGFCWFFIWYYIKAMLAEFRNCEIVLPFVRDI